MKIPPLRKMRERWGTPPVELPVISYDRAQAFGRRGGDWPRNPGAPGGAGRCPSRPERQAPRAGMSTVVTWLARSTVLLSALIRAFEGHAFAQSGSVP